MMSFADDAVENAVDVLVGEGVVHGEADDALGHAVGVGKVFGGC